MNDSWGTVDRSYLCEPRTLAEMKLEINKNAHTFPQLDIVELNQLFVPPFFRNFFILHKVETRLFIVGLFRIFFVMAQISAKQN